MKKIIIVIYAFIALLILFNCSGSENSSEHNSNKQSNRYWVSLYVVLLNAKKDTIKNDEFSIKLDPGGEKTTIDGTLEFVDVGSIGTYKLTIRRINKLKNTSELFYDGPIILKVRNNKGTIDGKNYLTVTIPEYEATDSMTVNDRTIFAPPIEFNLD